MAVYLKDLPAQERTAGSSRPSAEVFGAGEALYAVHCATCHLPTGRGAVETGPSLAGNPVVQAVDPASLVNVILFGPDLPQLPLVQRTAMEPYVDKLSDEEIAALSSFIRSAWSNRAGAVSSSEVARQR
jgi:mono/diheme cytochrome c family protein